MTERLFLVFLNFDLVVIVGIFVSFYYLTNINMGLERNNDDRGVVDTQDGEPVEEKKVFVHPPYAQCELQFILEGEFGDGWREKFEEMRLEELNKPQEEKPKYVIKPVDGLDN